MVAKSSQVTIAWIETSVFTMDFNECFYYGFNYVCHIRNNEVCPFFGNKFGALLCLQYYQQ